jgi:Fe-S-cluster containining protein
VVELKPGIDQIPPDLTVEREGAQFMDQHGDGTCVALDRQTRLCTIYEQRPQTCRIFERGSDLCRRVLSSSLGKPLSRF